MVAAEITDAIDDAGSNVRYGGYVEKEDRRRRREKRLERAGKEGGLGARRERIKENPECVLSLTVYCVLLTIL